MTQFEAFCKNLSLDEESGKRLVELSEAACQAQVNEHNNPDADSVFTDTLIQTVEEYCKERGIGVEWPGLYPIFKYKSSTVFLPN